MGFKAGYRFRVKINATAYGCADVGVDASVDPQDVSNTEGYTGQVGITPHTGYSTVIGGLKSARVNFRNATFLDDENPFVAPYSAYAGEYVALRVYLFSTTSVNWYFPSFFVGNVSWNGQVRGLQPISISGQNDGLFYYPDGSA